MPWDVLAVDLTNGQPGSRDFEYGMAVLQARVGLETVKAATEAAAAATASRELARTTGRLAWATVILAGLTFAGIVIDVVITLYTR